MRNKIPILEDEIDREEVMLKLLGKCFPEYEVFVSESSAGLISYLEEHLEEAVVIALDHDLPYYRKDNGEIYDAGTGREVADYLANKQPVCSVIIHSTNTPAAIGMEMALNDGGWKTDRISPYNDLDWVPELWLPVMKKAIARTLSS